MTTPTSVRSLADLIEPDRVHGSLYTDPAIYDLELERIWRREWVFVGHASEVQNGGDRIERSIGPWPATLHRAEDGTLDVPEAARVDSVHGFVFASLTAEGPTLAEHLGDAIDVFERLARLSPTGDVVLNCGWLHHKVTANWKMLVENETDGYHPKFVHESIFAIAGGPLADLFGGASAARTRELGNGHAEFVLGPQFETAGPMAWCGATPAKVPKYTDAMRARYGAEQADQIMVEGSPHAMIFPNLFIAEVQIFVLQPVAVDETVQHVTTLQLAGAHELNRRLLQQAVGSVGPAGLLLADDAEMYERNYVGVQARSPEWLVLKRGLHRERPDARGHLVGHVTDETSQRHLWQHYKSVMTR